MHKELSRVKIYLFYIYVYILTYILTFYTRKVKEIRRKDEEKMNNFPLFSFVFALFRKKRCKKAKKRRYDTNLF